VYRTLRDQLADDPIIADQPPAAREWLVEVTATPLPRRRHAAYGQVLRG